MLLIKEITEGFLMLYLAMIGLSVSPLLDNITAKRSDDTDLIAYYPPYLYEIPPSSKTAIRFKQRDLIMEERERQGLDTWKFDRKVKYFYINKGPPYLIQLPPPMPTYIPEADPENDD